MIYTRDYDTSHLPAIPVVEITLENTETGIQGEQITAIVDSGADSCILPASYLDGIGSAPIRKAQMIGVTSIGVQVDLHLVILHLVRYPFMGLRLLPINTTARLSSGATS